MKPILAFLILAVLFLIIDLIWLGFIAGNYYRTAMGPLMADEITLWAAFAFYVLYAVGLFVFVAWPALEEGDVMKALLMGALFGAVAYGTYDLTAVAVIKNFPVHIALMDIAWGAVLSALTSAGTVLIGQKLLG